MKLKLFLILIILFSSTLCIAGVDKNYIYEWNSNNASWSCTQQDSLRATKATTNSVYSTIGVYFHKDPIGENTQIWNVVNNSNIVLSGRNGYSRIRTQSDHSSVSGKDYAIKDNIVGIEGTAANPVWVGRYDIQGTFPYTQYTGPARAITQAEYSTYVYNNNVNINVDSINKLWDNTNIPSVSPGNYTSTKTLYVSNINQKATRTLAWDDSDDMKDVYHMSYLDTVAYDYKTFNAWGYNTAAPKDDYDNKVQIVMPVRTICVRHIDISGPYPTIQTETNKDVLYGMIAGERLNNPNKILTRVGYTLGNADINPNMDTAWQTSADEWYNVSVNYDLQAQAIQSSDYTYLFSEVTTGNDPTDTTVNYKNGTMPNVINYIKNGYTGSAQGGDESTTQTISKTNSSNVIFVDFYYKKNIKEMNLNLTVTPSVVAGQQNISSSSISNGKLVIATSDDIGKVNLQFNTSSALSWPAGATSPIGTNTANQKAELYGRADTGNGYSNSSGINEAASSLSQNHMFSNSNSGGSTTEFSIDRSNTKISKVFFFRTRVYIDPNLPNINEINVSGALESDTGATESVTRPGSGNILQDSSGRRYVTMIIPVNVECTGPAQGVVPNRVLNITAKLSFKDNSDANGTFNYLNAADSDDHISTNGVPSGENLDAAMTNSNFYEIGGIKYSESATQSRSVSISASKTWSYYQDVQKSRTVSDGNGGTTTETYVVTQRKSFNRSKTFNVPIAYSYLKLDSLRIYDISRMNLNNDPDSLGNRLFSNIASSTSKSISQAYKDRFNTFEVNRYGSSAANHIGVVNGVSISWSNLSVTNRNLTGYAGYYGVGSSPNTSSSDYDISNSEISPVTLAVRNDKVVIDGTTVITDSPSQYTISNASYSGSTLKPNMTAINPYGKTKAKTKFSDYINASYSIPSARTNGQRILSGKVFYNVITDTSLGKNGSGDSLSIGNDTSGNDSFNQAYITAEQSKDITGADVEPIIVHTPISANYDYTDDFSIIDQRITGQRASFIAQRGGSIAITPVANKLQNSKYSAYGYKDYTKYIRQFAIRFPFEVSDTYIGGVYKSVNGSSSIARNTWIPVAVGDELETRIATNNSDLYLLNNTFTVAALSNNINSYYSPLSTSTSNYSSSSISSSWMGNIGVPKYTEQNSVNEGWTSDAFGYSMAKEAKYAVVKDYQMDTVGRLFDFRITDVSDVDWKSVFRNVDTNSHNGYAYYSGAKRWNATTKNSTLGSWNLNASQELPIGSMSSTVKNYISAPKLGYRFSFDLRTSGAMNTITQRTIRITPTYYYVSKNGSTIIDNIDLYYKDSVDRYIKVGSALDRYKIYMRPKDGTRLLVQNSNNTLSANTIDIGSLQGIQLDARNMSTDSASVNADGSSFIQNWYGEFKLPNTTIAVATGETDVVNKKLTNGYICVKFKIVTVENGAEYLSYDQDMSGNMTTQWDYENYKSIIPLENGQINAAGNEALYKKIRGTVFMYDTDARASTDFDVGGTR